MIQSHPSWFPEMVKYTIIIPGQGVTSEQVLNHSVIGMERRMNLQCILSKLHY